MQFIAGFIIGLTVGVAAGFAVCALLVSGKLEDKERERLLQMQRASKVIE